MARTAPSGSPGGGGGDEPRTRRALARAECQDYSQRPEWLPPPVALALPRLPFTPEAARARQAVAAFPAVESDEDAALLAVAVDILEHLKPARRSRRYNSPSCWAVRWAASRASWATCCTFCAVSWTASCAFCATSCAVSCALATSRSRAGPIN